MNKIIIIGRITKDIEVKTTQKDIKSCQFTVAVNRNFKNKDGNYDADFISCKAFRNTADFIGKYIKKGNLVCVEGSLQTGSYEKDGKTIYTTDVMVENITLLEKKEKEAEVPQNTKTEYKAEESDITLTDADLPF